MLIKKRKTILTTAIVAVLLLLVGFITFNIHVSNLSNNDTGDRLVAISYDFPSTSDLNEMISEADIVVIGEYEGFNSKWNMARNPNNLTEEDRENYVEGHLYNFKISEFIKGETENKIIKVNHRFAETVILEDSNEVIASDGTITKKATKVTTKEVENIDPLFIEPKMDTKYMLFLKQDRVFQNYYGAIEPFAITFDERNLATLQTNIDIIDEDSLSTEVKMGAKTFILKNELHETITDTISGLTLGEIVQRVETFE